MYQLVLWHSLINQFWIKTYINLHSNCKNFRNYDSILHPSDLEPLELLKFGHSGVTPVPLRPHWAPHGQLLESMDTPIATIFERIWCLGVTLGSKMHRKLWIWLMKEILISRIWLINSHIEKLIKAFVSLNWLISTIVNAKFLRLHTQLQKIITLLKSREIL